jgi:hypothetical protein
MKSTTPLYYSRYLDGHRSSYLDFVKKKFGGERLTSLSEFISRRPILFLMVEEYFVLFAIVSLLRSVIGVRTVGLVFRPKQASYEKKLKMKLKRFYCQMIRKSQNITTLTIIPHYVDSNFKKLTKDWIYDFQMWDLNILGVRLDEYNNNCLIQNIKKISGDRIIISAIGSQDANKAFDVFSRLAVDELCSKKYCFVIVGKIGKSFSYLIPQIEENGGFVLDKYVADDEIYDIYRATDIVWCVYSPGYDQASGILGRARQFNKMALVRSGSYSEKICSEEGVIYEAIDINIDPYDFHVKKLNSRRTHVSGIHSDSFEISVTEKLSKYLNLQK